jgi:UDP-N-acetylmuramyl pentapeptide phosphotransferase/UDP-N-acetylglucosamine-1-phosphate transferase
LLQAQKDYNLGNLSRLYHGSNMTFPYPPQAAIAIALLSSVALALSIVLTKHWHGRHSLDSSTGVQKIHSDPTPRIGGLAVLTGMILAWVIAPPAVGKLLGWILLASLPAFLFGMAEDFTKSIGVIARLSATFGSGLFAVLLGDVLIERVDVPLLDLLLSVPALATLFTVLAIAGLCHAVNLIDGYNGLSTGSFLISLVGLGMIAQVQGDTELVHLSVLMGAAALGFFLLNFPFGKLFLGDSGAYLLGFLLSCLSVLLVNRNPAVSPWAAVLACSYPIIETLFTILRRLASDSALAAPDRQHLHSLIGALLSARLPQLAQGWWPHVGVCLLIWPFVALGAWLGWQCSSSTPILIGSFTCLSMCYAVAYWQLAAHARRELAPTQPSPEQVTVEL